jgi:hypothetical protein
MNSTNPTAVLAKATSHGGFENTFVEINDLSLPCRACSYVTGTCRQSQGALDAPPVTKQEADSPAF